MKTPTETILTFGLSTEVTTLVTHLVSSFEIDTVPLTIGTVRNFVKNHPNKKICLVIYHIDSEHPRQPRVIQLIRDFVGALVPFLVLVPGENLGEIKKYLNAGADDFIELPINESRFSISFLILLEMGQALEQAIPRQDSIVVAPARTNDTTRDGWERIVDYFQGGLSFFSPKSLTNLARTEHISDRWQRIRRIGEGGFGIVWLVKEIGTNRLAVAKTPHSPAMNIGVLRSAAILKRLVHHPNVVQLIEVVKDSGRFILIQEYAEGPTLQELLERGIPALDKENYILQLISVISYAHKHKILHRDIKPENIIITKTGRIKLLDFGIARDLSWQTTDGSSAGTVNFMPPEQFEGKSCIASDVWAIGVILYIFATNAVPYFQLNDRYPMDIEIYLESREPHLINPGIDIDLERIIMRCLQKDLDKRYESATELENDLREYFPQFGRGEILPS
ncbi:MAG: serine/threonine-protein kinase [Pseudomonadota bacterium]